MLDVQKVIGNRREYYEILFDLEEAILTNVVVEVAKANLQISSKVACSSPVIRGQTRLYSNHATIMGDKEVFEVPQGSRFLMFSSRIAAVLAVWVEEITSHSIVCFSGEDVINVEFMDGEIRIYCYCNTPLSKVFK
jgi:hypothetical protein